MTRRAALTGGLGGAKSTGTIPPGGSAELPVLIGLEAGVPQASGTDAAEGLVELTEAAAPALTAYELAEASLNRTHDGGAVLAPRPGWWVELTASGLTCAALLMPLPTPLLGLARPDERAADVAPRRAGHAEAVAWLRGRGMTLAQLARALGVSRQAIHNWEQARPIDAPHLERLLAVQDVMERAQRRFPTPDDLMAWLVRPRGADGITPLEAMARGDIDRARYLAISVPSARVRPSAPPRSEAERRMLQEQRQVAVDPDLDDVLTALDSEDDDGEEDG